MPDTMTVNGAEYTVLQLLGTRYYIDTSAMPIWSNGTLNMDCAGTGKDGGDMKILWGDRLLYAIPALLVLEECCYV